MLKRHLTISAVDFYCASESLPSLRLRGRGKSILAPFRCGCSRKPKPIYWKQQQQQIQQEQHHTLMAAHSALFTPPPSQMVSEDDDEEDAAASMFPITLPIL